MNSPLKTKVLFGIVVFSGLLILGYDLFHIWKNRPKACDLKLRNCSADFVCSAATSEAKPRCLPKASAPSYPLDIPFSSGAPVLCRIGNQDGTKHITDSSLFALELEVSAPEGMKLSPDQKELVTAAGDGIVFVDQDSKTVKVLHQEGYYSYYSGFDSVVAQDGNIRSGDILGRTKQPLYFSVHFLNPENASEVLKTAKGLSLSIPFKFKFSLHSKADPVPQIIDSGSLGCSPDSSLRIFRANTPL